MSETDKWMVYGANGHSGKLLLEQAVARGMKPIVAGRSREQIEPLARHYHLPSRVFALDDPDTIARSISDCRLVSLLAGPYTDTAAPMLRACLKSRTCYLDVTGESAVFEMAAGLDRQARDAGIMLVCGAGVDVIPSDCLALQLHHEMPDAVELTIAISNFTLPLLSRGSLKSILGILEDGYRIRRNGKLVQARAFELMQTVDFGDGTKAEVHLLPLSAPVSAYHSTGIPNITYYGEVLPRSLQHRGLNLGYLSPCFGLLENRPGLVRLLQRAVQRLWTSPSAGDAGGIRHRFRVEVRNAAGRRLEARISIPYGYVWTASAVLCSVQKVLGGTVEPGYRTPSLAFGGDFVYEIPGTERLGMREIS